MPKTVAIDCFPDSVEAFRSTHVVVGIDVIRATTTAVTAVACGRRCFPVPSLEEAVPLAARLEDPLLVGELGGNMPYGFHLQNSPAQVTQLAADSRPLILLSTTGTRLLCRGDGAEAVYAGCLRNVGALARHLGAQHERVALIGAGTRGEFREEDQLCCAWLGARLVEDGFEPQNDTTALLIDRWKDAPVDVVTRSKSAEYLRSTGQLADLDFVLTHVDDLDVVVALRDGELVRL